MIASIVLLLAGAAAPETFHRCPKWIQTRQALVSPPAGWGENSAMGPNGNALTHIEIATGPEPDMGLHPDLHWTSPTDLRVTSNLWRLDPRQQYWIVCGYLGTSVQLVRKLPKGISRCMTRTTAQEQQPRRAQCR